MRRAPYSRHVSTAPPSWSLRLIAELDAADHRAAAVVAGLSPDQLNWQPDASAWSIGQCLDHLRAGNGMVLPALSVALAGREPKRVEELELSWLSRWF